VSEVASSVRVAFSVNGSPCTVEVAPLKRLLDVLREDLGLTGTKEGCGEGECGACSVIVDGEVVNSCLVPACQVRGADVRTIEDTGLESLREAFLEEGGTQCGICTPGVIVAARAFLDGCRRDGVAPEKAGARLALAGNLCRCTGYEKILVAVQSAAEGESS